MSSTYGILINHTYNTSTLSKSTKLLLQGMKSKLYLIENYKYNYSILNTVNVRKAPVDRSKEFACESS